MSAEPHDTSTVSTHEVDRRLASGEATPLLAGHRPVPVHLDGRWWHLPQGRPLEAGYVLAPPENAAVFDDLLSRLQAAATAVVEHDEEGKRAARAGGDL